MNNIDNQKENDDKLAFDYSLAYANSGLYRSILVMASKLGILLESSDGFLNVLKEDFPKCEDNATEFWNTIFEEEKKVSKCKLYKELNLKFDLQLNETDIEETITLSQFIEKFAWIFAVSGFQPPDEKIKFENSPLEILFLPDIIDKCEFDLNYFGKLINEEVHRLATRQELKRKRDQINENIFLLNEIKTPLENLNNRNFTRKEKEQEKLKLKNKIDTVNENLKLNLSNSITLEEVEDLISNMEADCIKYLKKIQSIKEDQITKHIGDYKMRKDKIDRQKSDYRDKFNRLTLKFTVSQVMTVIATNNSATKSTLSEIKNISNYTKRKLEQS